MSTETVNQMVDRLVQTVPLTTDRFAVLLDAPLKPGETNPFWNTFTFELTGGPFAGGELRLNAPGDGALLILKPRDPPGLGEGDIDSAALGQSLGVRPNPHIPPEGVDTDYFQRDGVQVAAQWTHTSRRLRSLVLNWEPPAAARPPANGAEIAPGA